MIMLTHKKFSFFEKKNDREKNTKTNYWVGFPLGMCDESALIFFFFLFFPPFFIEQNWKTKKEMQTIEEH